MFVNIYLPYREVSTRMSKVSLSCFGFALFCEVRGFKEPRFFVIQSEVKLEPIVSPSHSFSRAFHTYVFFPSLDWFTGLLGAILCD